MSLEITELQLTDANTISIPTDAILMLSLLIVFALLVYFFHNILNNQISQFIKKTDNNPNNELVKNKLKDQLILESTIVSQEKVEKPKIKKLNFLLPSKILGIGSLAVMAIGGSSLIRLQSIQNSYTRINNKQDNIKIQNQSAKSELSMAKRKLSNKSENKIKKISYINPLVSTNNSSKSNNYYKIKNSDSLDFFSF